MKINIPLNQYLRIKVIPKSPKNEVVEIMEEIHEEHGKSIKVSTIKIRIKAVPEKGRANAELIKFLSGELNVPKENISIISGASSQLKLVKVKY